MIRVILLPEIVLTDTKTNIIIKPINVDSAQNLNL